jgi:hypothetical protein
MVVLVLCDQSNCMVHLAEAYIAIKEVKHVRER